MQRTYQQAGQVVSDILETPFGGVAAGVRSDTELLNQFRQDQIYTPTVIEDTFVTYDGIKIYTSYKWPVVEAPIDKLQDEEWLEAAFESTKSVGLASILFIDHKKHKLMDYIPQYLSNPAFMAEKGNALKVTLKSLLDGKARNDVVHRYQRLLAAHPIMFETLAWLSEFRQDFFGTKLFTYGFHQAMEYIKRENLTDQLIHEAISNLRKGTNTKRFGTPSNHQMISMYRGLLATKGEQLVDLPELVYIGGLSWSLAKTFIRAKQLNFNEALSVFMSVIHRNSANTSPYDNFNSLTALYEEYGPSDQWPTLHNVVQYVNATVAGRVQQPPKHTPPSAMHSTALPGGTRVPTSAFD